MEAKTYIVNPIPPKAYTWSWLKINNDSVTIDFDIDKTYLTAKDLPKGVTIKNQKEIETKLEKPNTGSGKIWDELFSENDQVITIDGEIESPVMFSLNVKDGTNTSNVHVIHAMPGSKATVILYSTSDSTCSNEETGGFNATQTKIYAEKDSEIKLIKIQMIGKNFNLIDETSSVTGENAKIFAKVVNLGGSHIDSGIHTDLRGNNSEYTLDFAYLCQHTQYLDMNHEVDHIGTKTICQMNVDGTLMHEATKIYRGTIDLQNGSSGSDGNEVENCLVLSPKTVNKSMPIIICSHDDVHGEHGSTIGRIAPDIMFYMQSRGISKKRAKMLIAKAKLQAIISEIENEELNEKVSDYVENAFAGENNE